MYNIYQYCCRYDPAIRDKKLAFENKKLAIDILNSAIEKQRYNEPTKTNIILVYNMIETNQIFGAPEVKDILKCSASSSKDIMKKLRDMGVVVTVKGKGKGKYRFAYDKEKKSKCRKSWIQNMIKNNIHFSI